MGFNSGFKGLKYLEIFRQIKKIYIQISHIMKILQGEPSCSMRTDGQT